MFGRPSHPISKSVEKNLVAIQSHFENDDDFFIRDFSIQELPAFVAGIQGLVDKQSISNTILGPLAKVTEPISSTVIKNTLSSVIVQEVNSLEQAMDLLMYGNIAVFVEGQSIAFIVDVSAGEQRNVEEPKNEVVIRGPHVGFIENLTVNTSLVRRTLHNRSLKVESHWIGDKTKNKLAMLYLDGIAYPELIDHVRNKLKNITTDAVLDSGYLEQLMEPSQFSLFPTIRYTERPETVSASLLEGRISILIDGSPAALILPHLFLDNFVNPEDHNSRPYYSSVMRLLRIFGFFLSTQLPALYVAVENYHKELVPSNLLLSIAGAREGVPFPLAVETFLMVVAFELIKESGIRMPQALGASISLVAGLILGEAAVQAGLVGIPTIIIVALAGLSSFLAPKLKETDVLMRALLIVPASFLGLFGVILADIIIAYHMVSLRSCGVPYFAPISPTYLEDWKDALIRFPTHKLEPANKHEKHNIGKYIQFEELQKIQREDRI